MAAPEDQPLRFRSGFAGELGSKLHEEALKGEGTDIEFRIGETDIKTVHAHALVVRTESEVFRVMLCERWKTEKKPDNDKTTIQLPEDKYSDFVLFLQLVYGFQDLTISNFDTVLPAYKLVDKYAAHRALQLCDDYFQFLIDNMKKLDAAKLLWMAKDNQIDVLYEAALAYVKTNLHLIWHQRIFGQTKFPHEFQYQSWMDWDEETWMEIISTDGLKVVDKKEDFNWSSNEFKIFYFTRAWIHLRRPRSEPKTPRRVSLAVDLRSLYRAFSKIRFLQMDAEDFEKCIRSLFTSRMSKGSIADICVAYCTKGEGVDPKNFQKEKGFEVDKRLRNI